MLTEHLERRGYQLKRKTSQEFSSPCPWCGGEDRFCIWPESDQFWCRQCNRKGDEIQLLRDLDGMTFREAKEAAGGNGGDPAPRPVKAKAKPKPRAKGKIVATYDFTDQAGKLLFQEVRTDRPPPDKIFQRRPDGRGGWIDNVRGVRRVLYRLPELRTATQVFLVEGPKDAETVRGLGMKATANPMGSGKLPKQQKEDAVLDPLAGKKVFIIPDNDGDGRDHAQQAARLLHGKASLVKVLELPGDLPEAGDVTDYFEKYGDDQTVKTLIRLADETPLWRPPEEIPSYRFDHNADVLQKLRPMSWQIGGILPECAFYYSFGDPGAFKTFIELDRCLCIASGTPYHGHQVRQGTVFYIAGEGQQGLGRRIAAWHLHHNTKAKDVPFFVARIPTQLMDAKALSDVRRAIDFAAKEYGPPALVMIDTLARNFGDGDENATKDMNAAIANIDKVFGNEICRGIIHHSGHENKGRARGSIALDGAADSAFRMNKLPDGRVLVECTKQKDAQLPPAMLFEPEEVLLRIADTDDESFVLNLVAEGPEARKQAKQATGPRHPTKTMKAALEELEALCSNYEIVTLTEWRDRCLARRIYSRSDAFMSSVKRMQERFLIKADPFGASVKPALMETDGKNHEF